MTAKVMLKGGRAATRSRALNLFLEALPPIRENSEDWRNIEPVEFTSRHKRLALVSLAMVLGSSFLLFCTLPFARFSILLGLGNLIGAVTGNDTAGFLFAIATTQIIIIWMIWKILGRDFALRAASLSEEKLFRAGSEDWSVAQRIRSNVLFGLIHLLNLFVPISIAIGLSAGGWWFMYHYRKTHRETQSRTAALQEAGAVHAAHNFLAIRLIPVFVLVALLVALLII